MNVTAIGRTQILYNAIRRIAKNGHSIRMIVTSESADFYQTAISDFRDLAAEYDAKFRIPNNINDPDLRSSFQNNDSEIAVSINWPTRIPRPVLDAFDYGVVNGHAGDLPRYRGNAAPNWAIINGDERVVLTVHRMSEAVDSGPIFTKHPIKIDQSTYISDIYDEMYDVFPELFLKVIERAEDGTLEATPQPSDPSSVLRGYPRKPVDSELQWDETARHLARIVRASAEPLFGAYTWLDGQKIRVWRAHAERPDHDYLGTPGQVAERRPNDGDVAVVTADGFLVLESVQHDNCDGNPQDATDVINSARTRLGMNITETLAGILEQIDNPQCDLDEVGNQS